MKEKWVVIIFRTSRGLLQRRSSEKDGKQVVYQQGQIKLLISKGDNKRIFLEDNEWTNWFLEGDY